MLTRATERVVGFFEHVVGGGGEDRALPELVLVVADEVRGEDKARRDGAD